MFDFGKFTNWFSGGLLDSHATWETYKGETHSWQATASQFSAPLVVFWGLGALVLGWIFGSGYGFYSFLLPIINGAIWFGIGGLIASFLAPKFGGTGSFDQSLAALTFASIPVALGSVVGNLPFIGWLIAFAGFVWTIMLLWQSLPVFLDIPLDRRTGHFFSTLLLALIPMLITYSLLFALGIGGAMMSISSNDDSPSQIDDNFTLPSSSSSRTSGNTNSSNTNSNNTNRSVTSPGNTGSRSGSTNTTTIAKDSGADLFGFGREVDYIESANLDTYSPPVDGMLQEAQVERTAKFFAAANRLREASTDTFEKLDDKNSEPSLGDLFKGVKGLVTAGTAEMQAVKSGGGNWAEHEWVKRQLFEARIHQDLNPTTEHNYELYKAYEARVADWL